MLSKRLYSLIEWNFKRFSVNADGFKLSDSDPDLRTETQSIINCILPPIIGSFYCDSVDH